MVVTFNEDSGAKPRKKRSFLDDLVSFLIRAGLVKTTQGAFRLIIIATLMLVAISVWSLFNNQESLRTPIPGVDFEPPTDPSL